MSLTSAEDSEKKDLPPALDFTSEHFDPVAALAADNVHLPFPKAKTYDNLAIYYSRTFRARQNKDESSTSDKKSAKQEIPRNYSWYYSTLGFHDDEEEDCEYKQDNPRTVKKSDQQNIKCDHDDGKKDK